MLKFSAQHLSTLRRHLLYLFTGQVLTSWFVYSTKGTTKKNLVYLLLCSILHCLLIFQVHATPHRWRSTWWSDPTSTIAIGWTQPERGEAILSYGLRAEGLNQEQLPFTLRVNVPEKGKTYWAQLSGLQPDTAYSFNVETVEGKTKTLWFKTAPAIPKKMTIIAGGDSRNHRAVRRAANKTVAEIQPDLVLFGGDFTASDSKKEWRRWFDDWQLSIDQSGRLIPLIPARGNHDSERRLGRAWGRAHPKFYYGITFGGDLLRVYTLNSERPAGGEQRDWLERDLKQNQHVRLRWAQYHKPMRPHVKLKSEGHDEYNNWAPLFAQYKVDLAIECDSHMMKMTSPLWPSRSGMDGFESVDRGTTFIGEGGWGAPLRSVDDDKIWTLMSERINHLFYIEVEPTGIYRITPLMLQAERTSEQELHSAVGVQVPERLVGLTHATPLIVPKELSKSYPKGIVPKKQNRGFGYSPLLLSPLVGSQSSMAPPKP